MVPQPAILRLCSIYQLLCFLEQQGKQHVSSSELGKKLGVGAHNVRKDISFLGEIGKSGAGYEISRLKRLIAEKFGFGEEKKACIVGLGRLGSAILRSERVWGEEFRIVVGFDSNINRLETLKTDIPLFPAYEITESIRRFGVELAIITVPVSAAQHVADKLINGGVKGIINFAPVVIEPPDKKIIIRNMDILNEFRAVATLSRFFGDKT